jgi:hypothetical protein
MNSMKLKLLEEILGHLSDSQANDLKSLLDESKNPPIDPLKKMAPEKEGDMDDKGKPKGISIEKVELMGKPRAQLDDLGDRDDMEDDLKDDLPTNEDDMTDDELRELIERHLG